MDLGIGRSGYPYQMVAFGKDLKDASGIVEESLEIIPRAWTEDELSYDGQHFQIPPREVTRSPSRNRTRLSGRRAANRKLFRQPAGSAWVVWSRRAGAPMLWRDGSAHIARPSDRRNRSARLPTIRVSAIVVASATRTASKPSFRGAELIDWYRNQQSLRNVRVWREQDPSRVPDDYQWHYRGRPPASRSPTRPLRWI